METEMNRTTKQHETNEILFVLLRVASWFNFSFELQPKTLSNLAPRKLAARRFDNLAPLN